MIKMDIFECIKKRRSIRKYTKKDISDETILKLLDVARYAPFGGPLKIKFQLWEFIIIRDDKIKRALAHDNEERIFVADAPVVIACCADTTKDPNYRDYDITVALAVENILLAATSIEVGTCYVTCYGNHVAHERERRFLRDILKLPEQIRLVCLITVSYPDEKLQPKALRDLKDMIHYEYWGRRR